MFNFWPKDKSESDIVRDILNDLEQGMLPRMQGGKINSRRLSAPFFHAPRHYKLKFCKGGRSSGNVNPYLFEIPEKEAFDIDYQWEFYLAEAFYIRRFLNT